MIRTNVRKGGGVAFEKLPRDFRQRMPAKQRKLARNQAILSKLQGNDAVVIDQQHRIDQLAQEMVRLREQLSAAAQSGTGAPAHERPPHY
jgi:ribosomal protein L4